MNTEMTCYYVLVGNGPSDEGVEYFLSMLQKDTPSEKRVGVDTD